MSAQPTAVAAPRPRAVTRDEIEFYRTNGWVHLKGLFAPADIAPVYAVIERMATQSTSTTGSFNDMWTSVSTPARDNQFLHAFTHGKELGGVAADLLGRPVKFWRDEMNRKMPMSEIGSGETPWHQDQPYTPADRSGRLAVWIALVDITPQHGALRFLSGSHRSGLLGRAFNDRSDAMMSQVAALKERFPISPQLHLRPGDATVHDGMTLHHAPPNTTREARWAYIPQFIVADALYTGAPSPTADGCPGLEVDKPFPEAWFPTVGWPRSA